MALLWEAKVLAEGWREEYNPVRPHGSLGTDRRRRDLCGDRRTTDGSTAMVGNRVSRNDLRRPRQHP
ncbi:MAG: hypothetical protein KAW67_05135 [Candidatus Eisenbacteria sp.]|nr:hypothetical protein [Candidatus Eisenbacteria bacterium]